MATGDQKGKVKIMNGESKIPGVDLAQIFENEIERKWLNTEEAARYLSITANALRIMVFNGKVKHSKFGRRLRFKVQDLEALFTRRS